MTDTRESNAGQGVGEGGGQGAGEGAGQTAGTAAGFDPFAMLGASWTASMDAMSAWSQTWQSLVEKRGGPTAELMMGTLHNPAAWPESMTPLMDEIRRALALPRFADLPSLNSALLPSPTATVDLMLLVQQYLGAMMPVWMSACEAFQSEVAERSAKGETLDLLTDGMDIWNTVLDRTLMRFNRSADFGGLQQRMLRMAMQQRQDTRKRVEMVAETLDMPTRTEMLDVYGRLHGLMREVHALRREVRALKARGAGEGAGGGAGKGRKGGAGATQATALDA